MGVCCWLTWCLWSDTAANFSVASRYMSMISCTLSSVGHSDSSFSFRCTCREADGPQPCRPPTRQQAPGVPW